MECLNKDIDLAMLVDDNETDNYVSEQTIKKAQFSKRLKVSYSIKDALNYLRSNENNLIDIPEVIFLDMNMPDADAFTFINGFEKLTHPVKNKCKLIILSSTDNEKELNKIAKNKYVVNLASKPMRKELLLQLKEGNDHSNLRLMKIS